MTDFIPQDRRTPRIDAAATWIEELFAGAVRKGRKGTPDVPYTLHLYEVAALVHEYGGDDDQIIAALLHDVVEDKGGADVLLRIEEEYGARVAALVDACTDSWVRDPSAKERWWPRKVRYINHIAEAALGAHLVCAADKVSNITSCINDYAEVRDGLFRVFNGGSGRDGQLWYYRRVTEELAKVNADTGGLVDRLQAAVEGWVREVEAQTDGPPIGGIYEQWCAAERETLPRLPPAPERAA
jgi:hypothetical protein